MRSGNTENEPGPFSAMLAVPIICAETVTGWAIRAVRVSQRMRRWKRLGGGLGGESGGNAGGEPGRAGSKSASRGWRLERVAFMVLLGGGLNGFRIQSDADPVDSLALRRHQWIRRGFKNFKRGQDYAYSKAISLANTSTQTSWLTKKKCLTGLRWQLPN